MTNPPFLLIQFLLLFVCIFQTAQSSHFRDIYNDLHHLSKQKSAAAATTYSGNVAQQLAYTEALQYSELKQEVKLA